MCGILSVLAQNPENDNNKKLSLKDGEKIKDYKHVSFNTFALSTILSQPQLVPFSSLQNNKYANKWCAGKHFAQV